MYHDKSHTFRQKDYMEKSTKRQVSEMTESEVLKFIAEYREKSISIKNSVFYEEMQEKYRVISDKLFKNKIYHKYIYRKNEYTYETYKQNINEFVKSYPVILSTTYSLRNSITNDFIFDYVIIDESLQVDLLTGSLAFSCAKNAIIVGDTKQLQQITDEKIKKKINNEEIDICYDYFENNILSSMLRIYGNNIPRKILREHYRCHPKIIEFCNKRYYNGELIAFANSEHKCIKKH